LKSNNKSSNTICNIKYAKNKMVYYKSIKYLNHNVLYIYILKTWFEKYGNFKCQFHKYFIQNVNKYFVN